MDRVLDHSVARRHKEFILVVEDHAEGHALLLDEREVSSIGVKDLNALDVANVNSAIPVHGDRISAPEIALADHLRRQIDS